LACAQQTPPAADKTGQDPPAKRVPQEFVTCGFHSVFVNGQALERGTNSHKGGFFILGGVTLKKD
jgi:hypothetical protein